jgi:multidrug efflux system membrane fusion protein
VSARADSTRFAALAKDGYITRQQLDQTFGQVNALAATVAAGRAAVEAARLDLDNATIRAPISGRTGQLAIRAGNIVRAQSEPPLVTINELTPVLVRFSVPEGDFEEMRRRAGLGKELRVQVTPGQEADSGRATTGVLTFVDNVVDRATGSVLLKARVENRDHQLWPGQFVQVGLELSVDQNAITIPTEAIVTNSNGSFLYVVDDSMRAIRTPVKVGRTVGLKVKIDSGLTGGERVVVEGQTRLTDGAKVQLRDTSAAATTARGRGGRGGRGRNGSGATVGGDTAKGRQPVDSAARESRGGQPR